MPNSLTAAENRVMASIAEGKLYKEAAAENNISVNTVKKHLKNVYRKLEVRSRREACIQYLKKEHKDMVNEGNYQS